MNTIDIVSLVIIGILVLVGLWHGLFRGIFRLLAWAAAIAGAYFANKMFAVSVMDALDCSEFSSTLICLCIGFLIPFLVLLFAGHIVNKVISDTIVSRLDRILGAIFGVVKAVLIIFVLLTILHVMPFGGVLQETRDTSVSYSLYKGSLEIMGFSSEPIDLVDAAEKKASEMTKNMTDKAADKAKDVAENAAEKATEVAKDAANKAVETAKDVAADAAKEAVAKATESMSQAEEQKH